MIETELKYGDEEFAVLTDLLLQSAKGKKSQVIWRVILIVVGLIELGCGICGLISQTVWLTIFGFVVAVVAFFLAFGGEKLVYRRIIFNRTKKMNEHVTKGYRKYTFSDEQTTVTSEVGSGSYNWDIYAEYGEFSHYLWLRRKDFLYVLVDKNNLSDADNALLLKYCSEKIGK